MTDNTRNALLAMLADFEHEVTIEKTERAQGWLLLVTDTEFGTQTVYGPVADPVEAMRRANRISDELNGDDEPCWTVTVLPLLPIDNWGDQ